MSNNQGIYHLRLANNTVACRNRAAHVAIGWDQFAAHPGKRCARCVARFNKMKEITDRKRNAAPVDLELASHFENGVAMSYNPHTGISRAV